MKRIILTFLLIGGFASFFVCCNNEKEANKDEIETRSSGEELVFTVVEKMPEFPGGDEALLKFISNNVKYPESAQQEGIQGRVVTTFVIDEDGSVSDAEVVRGIDPALDKEALRVVNQMPNWIPGEQRGEKVKVKFTLPIAFSLGTDVPSETKAVQEEGDVYTVVDKMPEFPGGDGELMKFINKNVKYPVKAVEEKLQGRVVITFVVNKDGAISNAQVVRGIDPLLDEEALRVVNQMPKWKPGEQAGKVVAVKYTIPVVFRLQ